MRRIKSIMKLEIAVFKNSIVIRKNPTFNNLLFFFIYVIHYFGLFKGNVLIFVSVCVRFVVMVVGSNVLKFVLGFDKIFNAHISCSNPVIR